MTLSRFLAVGFLLTMAAGPAMAAAKDTPVDSPAPTQGPLFAPQAERQGEIRALNGQGAAGSLDASTKGGGELRAEAEDSAIAHALKSNIQPATITVE